jgi:hypothetical protein
MNKLKKARRCIWKYRVLASETVPLYACVEAGLYILEKQMRSIDSWHQVNWDKCNFKLFMPASILFQPS